MTHSINYHPANWLDQFFQDFDRSWVGAKQAFTPPVDVIEEKEEYVLRAELPGVPKEALKVEVKENRLTLSGKKDSGNKDGEYRHAESGYGEFSRSFELPRNARGADIRAEHRDGVLVLRVPKAQEAVSRSIEIR